VNLNAPDTITINEIPPGKPGIIATLKAMRAVVRQSKTDFFVRQTATQIVSQVTAKDWYGEACSLYEWVRDNIRYRLDPIDVELLHAPAQVLSQRVGDCDDFSILLAALLNSLGHPAAFKAVGFDAGSLSHVYVVTLVGNRWWAADATEPSQKFGWEPPGIESQYVLNIN
jgi:transglutaminase-like putative cysteine protease